MDLPVLVAGRPAPLRMPRRPSAAPRPAATPACAVVLLPAARDGLAGPLLAAAARRADRLVVVDVLPPERPTWAPAGRPVPTVEDRWAARLDALRAAVRGAGPARRSVVAVQVRCGDPVWELRDVARTRAATEVVVPGGHDDLVVDLVRQLRIPVSSVPLGSVAAVPVAAGGPA